MLESHLDAPRAERPDPTTLAADLASLRIDRAAAPPPRARAGRAVPRLAIPFALASIAAAAVVWSRVVPALHRTRVATALVVAPPSDAAQVSLTATGYVVPDALVHVGAKVAGRIARVRVGEGDLVNEGDVLAELDDASARASLVAAAAHASAFAARAEAAKAGAEEVAGQARRERSLVLAGAIAPSGAEDLERRLAALMASARASESEARAASADLAPLRAALADHVVRSPARGVVLARPMRPGEVVSPERPTIVSLYDPATIGVDVDVPEGRLALAAPGAEAEVTLDAYPGRIFPARVARIGRKVDRAKGSVTVRLVFTKEVAEAIPDMSARASFLAAPAASRGERPGQRTVPREAVVERPAGPTVFVIEGDRVRAVPVTLGAARGAAVELASGPPAGAVVVSSPPPALADGDRVEQEEKSR